MQATSIYAKITKTAAFAALAMTAWVATTAQARPHYIQDVQYVQGGAQLVITPPQLVIQAPLPQVYVAPPVVVQPRQAVVVPVNPPVYGPRYVRDRIYYVNGRAYMNGQRYIRGNAYGHYKEKKPKHKHHKRNKHHDDRGERHDQGRHGGPHR